MGKWGSLAGLIAMAAGLGVLYAAGHLFGRHPLSIGVQVLAPVLMIAARVTFGLRSFHGMANPTAGGLVTTGPYRYIRHPIYASIVYFAWVGGARSADLGDGRVRSSGHGRWAPSDARRRAASRRALSGVSRLPGARRPRHSVPAVTLAPASLRYEVRKS